MTLDEKAKKYGYSSEEERLLYKDVCSDNYPVNITSVMDYLSNEETYHSKKESIAYIKENHLLSLFNKVKDLSPFDRLVEIYLYAINYLSIITCMEKYHASEYNEATELSDGEKQEENLNSYLDLSSKKEVCYIMMIYVEGAIRERIPDKLEDFENETTKVKKLLLGSSPDAEPHF